MPDAKILIVEDERITALAIKHKLERLGYSVLAIESYGNGAIEKAQLKPDLILMDIVLKGEIDGIEAADTINQRFNIPIVYLTAYFDNETLEKAKLTKTYGYITKPFSDGDLKSTIETALHNHHIECKLKESGENLNAFLNAINEPAFLIDLEGNIEYINKYTENILGNVVNANIYDISPLEKAEYRRKCIEKAIETDEIVSFEDEGLGKFYEYRIYPISNENGDVSRLSIMGVDISNRKKAQKDLKYSENKFRELFNNMSNGVAVYKPLKDGSDFIFKDFNKSAEKIENIKKEDVIGKSVLELFPGVKEFGLFEVMQRVWKTGTPVHFPASRYEDQRIIGWRKNYVYKLPSGEIVAVYDDVTKRKKSEIALKENEAYYKTIFENTGTATLIVEEDTTISLVNSEFEKLYGYSKEEIEGKVSWKEFVEENYLQKMEEYHNQRRVNQDLAPRNYEFKFIDRNGNIKDVFTTIAMIPGTKKSLVSLLDITPKKKSIKALRKSKEKYRQLVENAHEGIWALDLEGITTFVNSRMAEMLDYTVEEMIEKPLVSFVDENFVEKTKEYLYGYKNDISGQRDFKFIKKDGKKIYTSIETSIIRDENENKIGLLALVSDITDRKKAEEQIKRTNIYHRGLIESSLDPLVTIGPDGEITDVNSATEMITGYSRKQLIGTDFSDYFTEPEKAREGYQRVFKDEIVRNYELKIKNKDGGVTSVSYNASVYKDDDGNVVGVFAAARDDTERKKAEKEIKSSLKEKEVLLREIHHRVKNNLQIISSLLSLQSNYINDDETLDIFTESQNRVKSMAMIHEKLYKSDCLVKINFGDYVNDLTENLFYNYKISPNMIKLHNKIDDVSFDINTAIPCGLIINELVTNCLKHAFPWFKTSKSLKESSEILEFGKYKIEIELKHDDENYTLTVADNGIGFPDEINFKETDSLGLQLVNNLVEQLDGIITLDKTSGTKFMIIFKENEYDERI